MTKILLPFKNELNLIIKHDLYSQQNGAPAYLRCTSQFLTATFNDKWMGGDHLGYQT